MTKPNPDIESTYYIIPTISGTGRPKVHPMCEGMSWCNHGVLQELKPPNDLIACQLTQRIVEMTPERTAYFKPWQDLDVLDKVPLHPGDGWEFLPHGAPPEDGDEYWMIAGKRWVESGDRSAGNKTHCPPGLLVGPYRRRVKTAEPPKPEPQQLPRCPKCDGEPMLHGEDHGQRRYWMQCTGCPNRTVVRRLMMQAIHDWESGDIWSQPAAGESPPTSPEVAPSHGLTNPATPSAAVGASEKGDGSDRLVEGDTFPQSVVERLELQIRILECKVEGQDRVLAEQRDEIRRLKKLNHHLREAAVMAIVERVPESQPAGSPDDWVTQDRVPLRKSDEYRYVSINRGWTGEWKSGREVTSDAIAHNAVDALGYRMEIRCRRKDLPPVVSSVEYTDMPDSVKNAILVTGCERWTLLYKKA